MIMSKDRYGTVLADLAFVQKHFASIERISRSDDVASRGHVHTEASGTAWRRERNNNATQTLFGDTSTDVSLFITIPPSPP